MNKPTKKEIWAHNALLGAAGMIQSCVKRIIDSNTATDESKALAGAIWDKHSVLVLSLKTRRDQQ